MALKVLGKLVYFLTSDDHTDYRSLCIVSERLYLHWRRIFRVTGLMFLPRKFKFTVRILV